jgi:hypothetical protein
MPPRTTDSSTTWKAVDAGLDKLGNDVRNEMADADDVLRGHLHDVLVGSTRSRVIGVVLLGLGIVLAAAGSVVGTLSG